MDLCAFSASVEKCKYFRLDIQLESESCSFIGWKLFHFTYTSLGTSSHSCVGCNLVQHLGSRSLLSFGSHLTYMSAQSNWGNRITEPMQ